MCCGPLPKRKPSQRAQRAFVGYGQSNLEMIRSGTFTVIPPSASITSLNCEKSAVITWLIGRPVYDWIVLIASAGPPDCIAAFTFESPIPGIGPRKSRGIDRYETRCREGS